jgi:hypothetical protein
LPGSLRMRASSSGRVNELADRSTSPTRGLNSQLRRGPRWLGDD